MHHRAHERTATDLDSTRARRTRSALGLALLAAATAALATGPATPLRFSAEDILPNDNRIGAGKLRDGVLTLQLEARKGTLHPRGTDGPGFEIEAFGEVGGPLTTPAPLIRIPAGTEVRASIRNALDRPLLVRGLHDRAAATPPPTLDVPPGENREIRFRATVPGTYFYWGRTSGDREGFGVFEDGQLTGALVVDPPAIDDGESEASPPVRLDDRILVINLWVNRDDTEPSRPEGVRHTFLVNGLSWPYTERLEATVGDSLRLRVINATVAPHPMHLHGFYYLVNARGDAWKDTIYASAESRLVVTELMRSGTTMSMSWLPKRSGHWLFHCHFIAHVAPNQQLREAAELDAALGRLEHPADPGDHRAAHRPAFKGMAGLMTGVMVTDPDRMGLREDETVERRRLRLYANAREGYFGERPAFSYVLQEGPQPPPADSIRIPGTPLLLTRDEPVEVTVLNRVPHPISSTGMGSSWTATTTGCPAGAAWAGGSPPSSRQATPSWSASPLTGLELSYTTPTLRRLSSFRQASTAPSSCSSPARPTTPRPTGSS
ncbi:MAG: multicopper oxidase domain-containing protein, partial [Longimicrobiales bacterium]